MKSPKNGKAARVPSLGVEGESLPTLAHGSVILAASFSIVSVFKYGFHFGLGRLLNPAEYGMFGVGEAILGIILLFTGSSFPWVATKFLSGRKHGAIKSCLLGNFLIGLIVCSLLYSSFVSGILRLESSYYYIVIILIVAGLIGALGNVYIGALQGSFKFKALGITRIIGALILTIVGLPLAMLGFGATGAMAGYVSAVLLTLGVGVYFTRDLKPLSGKWIDKKVYLLALPLFIGILGIQLLMNVDILGVKFFSPSAISDASAGYYKAVTVWARIPVFMIVAMMGAFFPFISRSTGDAKRLKDYTSKFIKYAFVFLLPITLIFILIPAEVITLLYPQDYAQGASALAILSVATFFVVLITVFATVFQATGKPTSVAMVLGPAVAIQVILLYLLVPKYGLGGAATATSICSAFGLSMLLFKYARAYGLDVAFSGIAKLMTACLFQGGLLVFFPVSSKLLVLAAIILSYVLYLVILSLLRFLEPLDVHFIFSGILPQNNKLLGSITKVMAELNRIGGKHWTGR